MLKFMMKFLLRKPNTERVSDEARILLIKKINDKSTYKKNKSFIVAMVDYYQKHNKFTIVQLNALMRVLNG